MLAPKLLGLPKSSFDDHKIGKNKKGTVQMESRTDTKLFQDVQKFGRGDIRGLASGPVDKRMSPIKRMSPNKRMSINQREQKLATNVRQNGSLQTVHCGFRVKQVGAGKYFSLAYHEDDKFRPKLHSFSEMKRLYKEFSVEDSNGNGDVFLSYDDKSDWVKGGKYDAYRYHGAKLVTWEHW